MRYINVSDATAMPRCRFLICIAPLLVLVCGCGGCHSGPEYTLPAPEDVVSIKVIGHSKVPDFNVPEKHWDAIYSTLQPCQPDSSPAKWVCLCDLSIRTNDDREHRVCLYVVTDGPGAFSVSPADDFRGRTYYRGGSSTRLRDAITAAYDDATKATSKDSERSP